MKFTSNILIQIFCFLTFLGIGTRASAQTSLGTVYGPSDNSWFGWAIDSVGDWDGDGIQDLAVGALGALSGRGDVRVISGADRSTILFYFRGAQPGNRIGEFVKTVGDVDGDGRQDLLIRKSHDGNNEGVFLLQGGTGNLLYEIQGDSMYEFSGFGQSACSLDDVDGDGYDDFAVGSRIRISVFSGHTGTLLYSTNVSLMIAAYSLANLGDVNGDGISDLVAGDHTFASQGLFDRGIVRVLSGVDGTVFHSVLGGTAGSNLGLSVDSVGDWDADGISDFVVGAPQLSVIDGSGYIQVRSGATGVALFGIAGSSTSEHLGTSVRSNGDLDGDGKLDILIASMKRGVPDSSGIMPIGNVLALKGGSGIPLFAIQNSGRSQYFGRGLAFLRDTDQDGVQEIAIGVPYSDLENPNPGKVLFYNGL